MLNTRSFTDRSFPFLLLIVCLLTYGVFIPWLGFYWDDWPVILMGKFFGTSAFRDFYAYDRPFSAWTYIVSLPVVGLRPMAWQIFTLLLRFAAGVFFWLTLRRVWPQQRMQTAWMAVLFLLHPVFTLQFISVAFSQHWTCALLYAFSLWAMLHSFGESSKRPLWGILAVGASALHLWTMEYFIGMEVFRYILIWLTLDPNISKRQKLGILIRRAAPYALILASYLIWRVFLFHPPQDDPNPVRFLQDLNTQPLIALLKIAQIILQDVLYMLVQVWSEALTISRVILSSRFFFFSVLFSIAVAVGLALYFSRFASRATERQSPVSPWVRQALWVGLSATLLGALPGWITYRQALDQPYGNRIAIPALFGLGILTVALVEWVTQDQNRKLILLSILCGIAVYSHVYTADTYREYWKNQRNFYWQLYWRAPALQPGTTVLSDSEVVLGAGDYSTVSAINLMYANTFDIQEIPYWFVITEQRLRVNEKHRLLAGKGISRRFRSWQFKGSDHGMLLINNSLDRCVQILSPGQPENSQLSPALTEFLPLTNLDRIILQPGRSLPNEIFGPEPEHGWCYYYQKANIARQSGDWANVITLGREAEKRGYEPSNKTEWLLFIDAYIQTGDFSAAEELTGRIHAQDPRLTGLLCTYWSNQTTVPEGLTDSISEKMGCDQVSRQ